MNLNRSALAILFSVFALRGDPPADLKQSEVWHWGINQGLPEENLYSLSETADGYLWLASRDGLIRFDGNHFVISNPGARAGFRDNGLGGALAIGNSLWVGARDYLAYSLPDEFNSFTNPRFLATKLPSTATDRYGITNMQATAEGTLFFRRADIIYRIEPRANGQPPSVPQVYLRSVDGEAIIGFHHGASGREWACTKKGLFLRRGTEWIPLSKQPLQANAILETRDGTLWAFDTSGLYYYDGFSLKRYPIETKKIVDLARALFEDRRGNLWIGLGGALARIREDKRLDVISIAETMRPLDYVKVITQTRDGAIWAGTNWGSLIRINEPVFQTISSNDGLAEDAVSGVASEAGGKFWVGTRARGIFLKTDQGLRLAPGSDRGFLHAMAPLDRQQLLVANTLGLWTTGAGASRLILPAEDQVMSHYRALSPNYGTHIYYNDAQSLFKVRLPLGAHSNPEKIAAVPLARSILEEADGIWCLSWDHGLIHVGKNGKLTAYPLDKKEEIRGYTLHVLSQDYFLVGTSVGAVVFDRGKKEYLAQRILFDKDQVFQVIDDEMGYVWFGCRRALLAASKAALIEYANGMRNTVLPVRFTARQGLSSTNFGLGTSSASLLDEQKTIWLASVGGLIHFNPRNIVGFHERLPCAIAEVLADGIPIEVTGGMKIPAGVRRLQIRYTVLNRKADQNPVFRYRLVGDDTNWLESELSQTAFTGLGPGTYRFELQARLASMEWSEPASLEMRIEPFWYQRTSVRAVAAVLLAITLIMVVQLRSRQIRIRNQELEEKVLERTEELARARDDAEALSRAKAQFLASMSHEIRTPMNGVVGMVDVLKHTPLNPDQQHLVQVISQSGEALIAILNDILDFSKIEAGALSFESLPFDLHELVEQCHELLSPQAATKEIGFAYEIAPEVPRWVMGDSTRVWQILLNLLSNALKFTMQGGVAVRVSAEAGERVVFEVIDTGIGIAADKFEAIFDVFTQAETSTTRRFGGTGLGLAICHRLAQGMQGSLGVNSVVNQGSVFTLRLPLPATAKPAERSLPQRPSAKTAKSLQRILVVEDNPVNRQVAMRMLAKLGYEVKLAHNGSQGVQAAAEERFDLILMDCHMPEMDGLEATRKIRALPGAASQLPIVALTAGALDDDRQRCFEAGMTGFLSKPIHMEDLRKLLASLSESTEAAPRSED